MYNIGIHHKIRPEGRPVFFSFDESQLAHGLWGGMKSECETDFADEILVILTPWKDSETQRQTKMGPLKEKRDNEMN